jgi:hypothetical protein
MPEQLKPCPFCPVKLDDAKRTPSQRKFYHPANGCTVGGSWHDVAVWNNRADPAGWVSVDDRLPDVGENTVVMWSDGEVSKMQGFGVTEALASFAVVMPTHWISQPPTTNGATK